MGSTGSARRAFGALLATVSLTGTAQAATPPVESLAIVGTSAAGTYDIGAATFGTSLYDVSGPIVLADGDGCGPLTPVPAGSIMLVDRGTCAFPLKAANAQAAGAAALVIVDSLLSAIPFIPVGVAAGVTIPVAGFTKDDGDAIKAAIAANESPTAQLLRRQPLLTVTALDGDFPDQAVGTIGPALRFRVENTGTADGVIGNAYAGTTTGAGSNGALTGADFLLGANYCAESTLTPGGGCTLYARFVPGTQGDINGMAGILSRCERSTDRCLTAALPGRSRPAGTFLPTASHGREAHHGFQVRSERLAVRRAGLEDGLEGLEHPPLAPDETGDPEPSDDQAAGEEEAPISAALPPDFQRALTWF